MWKRYRSIISGSLLLMGMFLITTWVVRTQRAPGAMTVIEAQAMDMTAMVTPKGVMPVATEKVRLQPFAPMVTYTGSITAFNEAEIVARVEGRVVSMPVYPGDRVRPGQLLVQLDSLERSSQARAARAEAEAARYETQAMHQEIEQMRAEVREAQRKRDAAQAMVEKAQGELEVARQELATAQAEREERLAEVRAAEADNTYWKAEVERANRLFKSGAVSNEELQRTQAEGAKAETELHHAEVSVQKAEARIKQVQAMIRAAQAQLTQAKREEEAMQASVSRAQSAVSTAQAKSLRARAMQEQASAEQQAAQIVQDYTRITADIPGVVTERLITPGTLVMPGTVLLRLKQDDRVRLQARVAVEDAMQIRQGALVLARFPKQAQEIRARVTSIFSAADPQSRTVTVEALVPNQGPQGIHLLPGNFLEMRIALSQAKPILTIPLRAVRRDFEGKPFVWTLQRKVQTGQVTYTCTMHPEVQSDKPGLCPKCSMKLEPMEKTGNFAAHRVNVELGGDDGKRTAVLAGLNEGDEVIWAGHEDLQEGTPVQPVPWGISGPLKMPEATAPMTGHEGHQMPEMKMEQPSNEHQGHGEAKGERVSAAVGSPQWKAIRSPKYVCPMHPEVVSDKPGECPKCHMKLEPKKESTK